MPRLPTRCPTSATMCPPGAHQVPTRCPPTSHLSTVFQLDSRSLLTTLALGVMLQPHLLMTFLISLTSLTSWNYLSLFITSTTVNSHDPSFYHHLFEKFTVNLLIWFIQMARIFHQDSSLPPRHPGKDFRENYYKYWTNIVSNWKYWAGIQRERLRVLCLFNCA